MAPLSGEYELIHQLHISILRYKRMQYYTVCYLQLIYQEPELSADSELQLQKHFSVKDHPYHKYETGNYSWWTTGVEYILTPVICKTLLLQQVQCNEMDYHASYAQFLFKWFCCVHAHR